ncbi:hypothetical protein GCM10027275_45380 [Rhabdobacter roseus]|uniref:Beta-lactamase regulating signal transducer with metallopeptidase domain/uncharacterized coiled-coil protein SlyX n=1 Tax=Rhabdobacter roseus TaxID=1655419 RepID=A0A840TZS0_9BACT|nr:M56 family metallopeptidase [Rhabdobacter roseus]MBB5286793.1 beta-lactamase regulating signal transducer with metallopeptidase domain/uncharacterized coiled-coil protein SlyX [Rhabdobacter roseus]
MKNLFDMIPPYAVSTLGWTLLHALWQGTLLALVAGAGFYAFRRRPAAWRYTLGVSVLAGQVLASLGTFAYYWLSRPAALPVGTSPTTGGTSAVALVQAWQQVYQQQTFLERVQLWLSTHLPELVVCWLVGAGLLLLRFVGSWVYLEVLRSRARLVMDQEWRTRFGLLTAKLNITQSVELRQTARVLSPLVIGALRPVVLVPVGLLTGFSVAEVEAILAHELAHIRRHDYLVNLLQSLVEIVFFFHPALWWLSERVRTEREHCCDDLAVATCGDRTSLAQALVRVAELQANPRLAMAFASRKPLLLRRIRRVLGVAPAPRRLIGTVPALLILTGLLVGVSVYAVGQQEAQKENRKKVLQRGEQKDRKVEAPETMDIMAAVSLEELAEVPSLVEVAESLELADPAPQPRYQVMEGDIYRYQASASDTTQKRLEAYQRNMEALQEQMEPLHRRMEELHLAMEKQQFDVERYHRAQEQIEWKKQQLMDGRQKLMEKRSALLYPQAAKGQAPAKLSESEVEKQLGELEQKVKDQEQKITELNAQLAQSRQEAHQAEEPSRAIQKEMETISQKMEVIASQMNREAREMEKYLPPPPPPVHVYGTGKKTVPPAPAASPAPPPPPVEKPAKATSIQGKAKVAPAASPKAASPAKK